MYQLDWNGGVVELKDLERVYGAKIFSYCFDPDSKGNIIGCIDYFDEREDAPHKHKFANILRSDWVLKREDGIEYPAIEHQIRTAILSGDPIDLVVSSEWVDNDNGVPVTDRSKIDAKKHRCIDTLVKIGTLECYTL